MGKCSHAQFVTGGDPMAQWRSEAERKNIPFDVYVAVKESFFHGLDFQKLLAAMRQEGKESRDEKREAAD